MPKNGVVNFKFGVYKTVCCGAEIVLAPGMTFPDCPKHRNLPTKWKEINDEPIPRAVEINKKRPA